MTTYTQLWDNFKTYVGNSDPVKTLKVLAPLAVVGALGFGAGRYTSPTEKNGNFEIEGHKTFRLGDYVFQEQSGNLRAVKVNSFKSTKETTYNTEGKKTEDLEGLVANGNAVKIILTEDPTSLRLRRE